MGNGTATVTIDGHTFPAQISGNGVDVDGDISVEERSSLSDVLARTLTTTEAGPDGDMGTDDDVVVVANLGEGTIKIGDADPVDFQQAAARVSYDGGRWNFPAVLAGVPVGPTGAAAPDPAPAEGDDAPANPPANQGRGRNRRRARAAAGNQPSGNAPAAAAANNDTTLDGNRMQARVGNSGDFVTIEHGANNDHAVNPAEARAILDALGTNAGENMDASVQVKYGNAAGTSFGNQSTMTVGQLYDLAGRTRPGTQDGRGNATLTYKVGNTTHTDTIEYNLDDGENDRRISQDEASFLRRQVRNRRRDASNGGEWTDISVAAEGESLSLNALGNRADLDDPDTDDDNNITPNPGSDIIRRNSRRTRAELDEKRRQLNALISALLAAIESGNVDAIGQCLNMIKSRSSLTTAETASYVAEALAASDERQQALNDSLAELMGEDEPSASTRSEITRLQSRIRTESNLREEWTRTLQTALSTDRDLGSTVSSVISSLTQPKAYTRWN